MKFRFEILIALALVWLLPPLEAFAEDSIINLYDANGNLISGDGKYYEYNDANQLVRVREKDTNGALVSEYFYDYTGQRVKKVENGVTTYYPDKHYETQVVQGQVQNTSYYFADGDRVAKKDATGISFYHPDHLGGISAVTNTTGQVVSSTSYLPFGEVRQGGIEKYSYTGKEKDKASDLYNFEARYVSPELRHFTQADIADPDFDDPQDLNRYAYVGNNPLSYVDPDGYKKKHHSKKEEKKLAKLRAAANAEKKAKKKAKEKQRAADHYAKHHPVSSGQKVLGNSVVENSFRDDLTDSYNVAEPNNLTNLTHTFSKEQKYAMELYTNQCLADAAYYSALAEGYQHTIDVTKKAAVSAVTGVVMLFAAPAMGVTVGGWYLTKTVIFGIGDIAAEYNGDELSATTMDTVNLLDVSTTLIERLF